MFDAAVYSQRRERLKKQVKSGLCLFPGNNELAMNYPANPFHFRQDSDFLYFFGLDSPGLAGIVDVDLDLDILFGDDVEMEDIIWMGPQPEFKKRAKNAGVNKTKSSSGLAGYIMDAVKNGRRVHFLPPYNADRTIFLGSILGIKPEAVKDYISLDLIRAVIKQRSVKIKQEVEEMELALETTYDMYFEAMKAIRPGLTEQEIVGKLEGAALRAGSQTAFPTILSINGQILHNHHHGNTMKKGNLVVIDSGAESPLHYAADITRTFPVSGKFTPEQKAIYEIVLKTQSDAIAAMKPGVMNKDIHLSAARTIAEGLKDCGLMKGNVDEAVSRGAHALFFPHGLGHMIGLDVHDMEGLGENYVGYDRTVSRSDQFGLAYLRMAKTLKPGYVLTVEPGIYFIPALIDLWESEKKHGRFIDYDKLQSYRRFGGIRIEDDVLVTAKGHKELGRGIPKSVEDIEAVMG
jgi:Xaa-Pro aminopeptidase